MVKSTDILHAGAVIHSLLTDSQRLQELGVAVTPVAFPAEATAPYVCYRRKSLQSAPNSVGAARAAQIEVHCYAPTYAGSVAVAEAVVETLESGIRKEELGIVMRSCCLTDAAEDYANETYLQLLLFNVKI